MIISRVVLPFGRRLGRGLSYLDDAFVGCHLDFSVTPNRAIAVKPVEAARERLRSLLGCELDEAGRGLNMSES